MKIIKCTHINSKKDAIINKDYKFSYYINQNNEYILTVLKLDDNYTYIMILDNDTFHSYYKPCIKDERKQKLQKLCQK
jgi:hypothetical protein